MGEKSDEDGKLLNLQLTPKKQVESNEKNCAETINSEIEIPVSLNNTRKTVIGDSEYLIYHPPKYTLPAYKNPKFGSYSLRDQVKVICSYHALISRSIANQAKIQIDSCSYPEPIEYNSRKTISLIQKKDDAEHSGDGSADKSEEYVSRAGRITKRKFYSETDNHKKVRIHEAPDDVLGTGKTIKFIYRTDVCATKNFTEELALKILKSSLQDIVTSPKGNGEDEVPTKRKAPQTPTRNRNLRQRQLKFDNQETETENKKKITSKTSSPTTRPKKTSDGFVEPAIPGTSKRVAGKTVECPICTKHFPEKKIEQHASSCGEIPMDVGNTNPMNIIGFRCHSCKEVLPSEEDYEIHCTTCNGGPSYLR